jgi:hypothetical protein
MSLGLKESLCFSLPSPDPILLDQQRHLHVGHFSLNMPYFFPLAAVARTRKKALAFPLHFDLIYMQFPPKRESLDMTG